MIIRPIDRASTPSLPDTDSSAAIVYLATVADYLWSPVDWDPTRSFERSSAFAERFEDRLQPSDGASDAAPHGLRP